jgi:hypothetical protein
MGATSVGPRWRWYLHALGHNPMIRRSDRIEAFSVLAVLVVAILSIPFAGHVGATTYDTQMRLVREQAHDRHPVRTVVIDGNTSVAADPDNPGYVRVRWLDGTGLAPNRSSAPPSSKRLRH